MATKIPIPPIPKPTPVPDSDDFGVEDDEINDDDSEDDDQLDDEMMDEELDDELDEEQDDQEEEQDQQQQQDQPDQKKKDEEDQKQDDPGKKREEDPKNEADRDPRLEKDGGQGAEGAAERAGEGAAKGATEAGQGAASAAGEGVAAAGEATAAAGETAAAGATALTGAAAAAGEGAVAAGGAVAGGAAATAPAWVPIVLSIVLVVIVIALALAIWRHLKSGKDTGSSVGTAADVSDSNLRSQIAELAAAAGDGTLRQAVTKEKLADVFAKLNLAATATANHPTRDLLVEHVSAAKTAAGVLFETTSSASGDEYTRQLRQFQYHLNAVAAALMGIGNDTAASLVARATGAFSSTWVWTGNGEDQTALLRDGSNTVTASGATRGCDASGFITYILRNPAITPTDHITPNVADLPSVFAPALTAVDLTGGFKIDYLKEGDIILTKRTAAATGTTKTDYGAFIYIGGDTLQLAYCGPSGLAKLDSTILTDPARTVTYLLRLRTAP